MFYNCVNLNSIPSDFFNLFFAGQININNCFNNCISLTTNMPSNFLWGNLNISWTTINTFKNAINISNYSEIPSGWK